MSAEMDTTTVGKVATGYMRDSSTSGPSGDNATKAKEAPIRITRYIDHMGTGTYHTSQTSDYDTVFNTVPPHSTLTLVATVAQHIGAFATKWVGATNI